MIRFQRDDFLKTLTHHYMPFTLLSEERLAEVGDVVRFVELRKDELFQLRCSEGHDYLYLIEGSVDVIHTGSLKQLASPESTRQRPYILPTSPHSCTVLAREDSVICHADRELLNDLIAWDEMVHFTEGANQELHDQLEHIRNSLVFRRLPLACVEDAFKRMKRIPVVQGQEIVRQGDEGEAFYVISEGRAETYEKGLYDNEQRRTEDLGPGDTFGHAASLTGKSYGRTVRMLTDGVLLSLGREDFQELIGKEYVKSVSPQIVKTMIENGYGLIDVRYPEEFDEIHIPGAALIPLYELRDRIGEVDASRSHVVYCHSGNRSAVASLLLRQHNIDVFVLEGGVRDWPYETTDIYSQAKIA